jgi:mannosyltransferase OCH1-like enzyme
MIPKIIHYCWFGGNPLPALEQRCIASWRKYCPDYEIRVWNESNFDITCNDYVRQAFQAKKFAFVSDYVRLYALYHFGGIYMDTDVEVLTSLDKFLEHEAFSGFETPAQVQTGLLASRPKHLFISQLLSDYDDRKFVKEDGTYDQTTNVTTITKYFSDIGFQMNNTKQTINQFTIYPVDYFCPIDLSTSRLKLTENTVTIHHFSGSWLPSSQKWKKKIIKLLGPRITNSILKLKRSLLSSKNQN